jgi:putative peptidoglycan lipid II flippase
MKVLLCRRQNQQQASRLLFLFENLNRAIGYLRNLTVSWVIGFGVLSDLYFLAFGLASSVSGIITGALSATFIPYSQKMGFDARRKLLGGSALATSVLFLVVVVPAVLAMLANASPALKAQAFAGTGLLITLGVIVGFAGIQLLQLTDEFSRSRRNFLLGGVLLLFVNSTALILLRWGVGLSPTFLGWATALPALLVVSWLFVGVGLPRWDWRAAVPYLRQTFPLMLSGSVGMVNVFIDRWFAAGFEAGRLSLLQTAFMLITQIGGAVVAPLINSAYPYFSEAYVNGQLRQAHAAVARLEDRILVVIYGFAGAFVLLGQWGLSFIYEHGAVHSGNIDALYETSCLYLPVFIYGSLVTLYLRILYCRGQVRLPAGLSMLIIAINIMLNLCLVEVWGWRALASSASFCAWLYFVLLVVAIHRRKDYPLRLSRLVLMNLPAVAALVWGLGI